MICFHIPSLTTAIDEPLQTTATTDLMRRPDEMGGMEMFEIFANRTVAVVHFTDQK